MSLEPAAIASMARALRDPEMHQDADFRFGVTYGSNDVQRPIPDNPASWPVPFPTTFTSAHYYSCYLLEKDIPLPVENDSFNAQPEAPACPGPATKKAGASGWALNEQMCHSSPVGV